MQTVLARNALLTAVLAACADPAARVSIVVVGDGPCGRPADATGLEVTAYAARGEIVRAVALDGTLDIADFPDDTEQLAVEVIVGGGAVGAAGKSAPFVFGDLADGTTIPIFMAPVDAFCPTGTLAAPRIAPLVARAGDGILVVGGTAQGGAPLSTAERYDPSTGTFSAVAVPDVLGENGFIGAALTALPDGRVVVSGGVVPTLTIYDPVTHSFGESVLIEGRAFHAAIAVDATHVLLAGGCSDVEAAACAGVVRKSSKVYDVDELGMFAVGPTLEVGRIGGTAIELGVQDDGQRAIVVAGGDAPAGSADPLAADRFGPMRDAVAVTGTHARAAALDGGALLTAAPSGVASVLAPGARGAVAVTGTSDLAGVRLVAAEDGRVLGFGADADGAVLRYDPMIDRWDRLATTVDGPGALAAPSVLRLDDGSILVLGGTAPSASVFRFRPSLVGATTGALTVVPGGAARQHVLTAVDPATVTRVPDWTLATSMSPNASPTAGEFARALVGGPRIATGSIRAVVRVRSGGVALVAQQRGPGELLVAELAPGAPARLVRWAGAAHVPVCTGAIVEPLPADAPTTIELAITDAARLTRDGVVLLACGLPDRARGAWGVAALGAGAQVTVETVTVAR